MKTGLTLTQLAEEIERQNGAKHDYVADTRALTLEDNANVVVLNGQGGFGITEPAHEQIAQRLQVPKKYYDRLRADHPDLLARNINTLWEREPEKRMLRTLDNRVRAFLSDRYRPLDHFQLAEALLPVIAEKRLTIASAQITERKMYIKAVDESARFELFPGDAVEPGVVISNSETGHGSLRIESSIYRLLCLNLHIIKEGSMRKYHVGRVIANGMEGDSAEIFYRDETRQLEDAATFHKAIDVLSGVFGQEYLDGIYAKLRGAREQAIEGKVEEVMEVTAAKFDFSQEEKGGILEHLIRGGDFTKYGLSNAVTRYSADVESYDRATELEAKGWEVIELPQTEWKKLAA